MMLVILYITMYAVLEPLRTANSLIRGRTAGLLLLVPVGREHEVIDTDQEKIDLKFCCK